MSNILVRDSAVLPKLVTCGPIHQPTHPIINERIKYSVLEKKIIQRPTPLPGALNYVFGVCKGGNFTYFLPDVGKQRESVQEAYRPISGQTRIHYWFATLFCTKMIVLRRWIYLFCIKMQRWRKDLHFTCRTSKYWAALGTRNTFKSCGGAAKVACFACLFGQWKL